MWSGPIHDSGFVTRVLEHLESNQEKYGTSPRMKGMLTVAKEVRIPDTCCHIYWSAFRKLISHSTSHRRAWLGSSTAYPLVSMTLRKTSYSTVNMSLLIDDTPVLLYFTRGTKCHDRTHYLAHWRRQRQDRMYMTYSDHGSRPILSEWIKYQMLHQRTNCSQRKQGLHQLVALW